MRKLVIAPAIATVFLLVLGSIPAAATPWQPNVPVNPGQFGVAIADSPPAVMPSFIEETSQSGVNTLCQADANTGPCNFDAAGATVGAEVMLPVCVTATQSNCIADLEIGPSKANLTPSTFIAQTSGPTFSADPTRNLPEGSTVALWTNPFLNGGGTTQYATDVVVHVTYQGGAFKITSFNASITPYSPQVQSWQKPPTVSIVDNSLAAVGGSTWECAYTDTSVCGAVQDFSPNTVASLSVRISTQVGGWFFGRLQNPSISVAPFDATSNLITVSAQPETVPGVDVTASLSATDTNTLSLMGSLGLNANSPSPSLFAPPVDGSNTPMIIDAMRALAHNAASGNDEEWNFGSFASDTEQNPCLAATSSVLGIVTTDAMAYDGSPPSFDGGVLSYSVAGMHFQPDQVTPFLGTYSLVMRDSVADCLYGFPSGPLSGTVTIVDSAANDPTSTTTVSDTSGWLSVSVSNFEFSNPTIQVRLSEARIARATPTAPRALRVKSMKSGVLLRWQAPSTTGSSPIIGYEIFTRTRTTKYSVKPVNPRLVKRATYRIMRGKKGVVYDAVVKAVNANGVSVKSNQVSFRLK